MSTAETRTKSTEGNGFCVPENLIKSGKKSLVPLSIAGIIREGSLLRDDSICLHFTDGKTEAHNHAICKKIIKAKIIVSVLYIF